MLITQQPGWADDTAAILRHLAKAALPQSDADHGSERQTAAEENFVEAIEALLPPAAFNAVRNFWHRATPEEGIAYALAAALDYLHSR